MENIIADALEESLRIKEDFVKKNTSKLIEFAQYLSNAFRNAKKLMICAEAKIYAP